MSIFKFLLNDDRSDEARAVRQLNKRLDEDSRKIALMLTDTLTRLQFDHWLPKDRRPGAGAAIRKSGLISAAAMKPWPGFTSIRRTCRMACG